MWPDRRPCRGVEWPAHRSQALVFPQLFSSRRKQLIYGSNPGPLPDPRSSSVPCLLRNAAYHDQDPHPSQTRMSPSLDPMVTMVTRLPSLMAGAWVPWILR